MVKIIGRIDKNGNFYEDEYETTQSTAPAMSVVASKPTVKTTVQTQPLTQQQPVKSTQTVKTTEKKKEDKSIKDAIKSYGEAIKNSAVKNRGLSWDNAITDLANLYDARRNIATSIPGIGKAYDVGTKTLGNIATNMGEGALKTGEGVLDTLNDWADAINNPLTYQANKAAYGKKTADKALKEAQKAQEDFLKTNLVDEMNKSTGYNDILPQWEQNSLVKRENFGGQVAQGVGGMVPSLLAGQYLGFAPELKSLEGLSGTQKAAAMASNVGRTYLSQLPANAILGASSYGSGLEEALNNGASRNQSRLMGLANMGIEQGTEMLTGGVPGLEGRGGIDQFIDPLIGKTGGYLNPLLKAGYGAFGEGLEEWSAEYLDALAKKGILGQDIDWNQVNKDALRSGLVGAATGAILNTPSNIQNFSEARAEKQASKPTQTNVQETVSEPTQMAQETQNVEERPINQEERKVPGEEALEPITQREENIDNSQQREYNEDVNEEGVRNDFRTIQEESRRMSTRDTEMYHSGERQVDEGVRNRLSTALSGELRAKSSSGRYGNTSLVNPKTNKTQNYYTGVDANTFHDNMEIVQKYLRNGDAVDVHDAADYKDTNNYLSEDGLSGFAITKDGDLISVFNMGEKGYLDTIAPEVQKNAKTLDCFQSDVQPLADMYEKKLGFKKAAEMDFNYDFLADQKGKEYADYFVKTYGEAPVVFMVKTDQDVPLKHFNKDQYEEAMNYRNSFVGEGTSDSSFSNENKPAVKEEPVIKTKAEEQQHYEDNGIPQEKAKILTEMPKPEKKPLSQRIKEGKATLREEFDYFKRNIVDKGEAIYSLAKKTKNNLLYAKYDKRGTTTGEANYDIGKAQTDLKGKVYNNFVDKNGKKKAMSLNQIWEGIDTAEANEYLAHQLNVDRYKQVNENGKNIQKSLQKQIDEGKITQEYANKVIRENEGNKYVFGKSVTDEDSSKRIKELEKEHPELKTFGKNVWQYGKNQLQNMVDAGMISEAQAKQFMKDTPHYVRLQRNVENTGKNLIEFDRTGGAKVNQQIKEFKGSNLDILPFKETMAQYTLDVRNAMRDNIFAQELAKTLGVSSTGETVNDLDDIMGVNPDLIKDNGDGTYSLTFFNKGKATTIPITEGIYESLQPNKHYKFEDKLLFKGIRKVDNVRKALLTDKNPLFLATNMMKDAFDAPLNSKYPASLPKNYLRAFNEIVLQGGKGANYQQYQALGGLQNTYFENQEFQKKGSKYNPLNWIEKANNAIEQLPRLAEFISTMEKTGDVDEAMYNAAEVTTNFKRGGDVAKAANRNGATFLNASIQGFDKQVRNFSDIFSTTDGKISVDGKRAVQMLGKVIALGIAPGLLNDLAWEDDDDYQDLQEYIKDNYYLLGKTKNGTWVRIPKGRAVSIFQSAARRTKYALKGEENAFKGFGTQIANQIAPNNPLENNIISPFVDVARNKSWSGNPIVSEYKHNETHQGEVEKDTKTDVLSEWLGKQFNYSPKKINYIIDQYSGVLGDILLPMGTKYAEGKSDNLAYQAFINPLLNKFTTNSVTSSKSQQEFYDALSKASDDNDKKWSGRTAKDNAVYKYLNSKSGEIAEIRSKIAEVQESDKSNEEKFEQTLKYTKEINKIAKDATKNSKDVEVSDNNIRVGDAFYTVNKGEANQIKTESVEIAKEFGIPVDDYIEIASKISTFEADKNAQGKSIRGSKQKKIIDYVEARDELTREQKIKIIQQYYEKYNGGD